MECNQKSKHATDPLYICNPKTGRWVLRSGKIGKQLEVEETSIAPKKRSVELHIEKEKIPVKIKMEVQTKGKIPVKVKAETLPISSEGAKEKEGHVEVPSNMKAKIIYYLTKMIDISKNQGEPFKAKQYAKAVQSIKSYPNEITSSKDVKHLEGIGKKIADKIDVIIKTGSLPQVEQLSQKDQIINKLATVWGIGPVTAEHLYNSGIHSLDDLKKHSDILNKQQQIGLKYYEDFQKKIPRKKIEYLDKLIHEIFSGQLKVIIAGSYRRGLPESGDVDILIGYPKKETFSFKDVINIFETADIITDVLSSGPSKALTVAHLPGDQQHFRMDLEFIPEDQWGAALLYFTGSKIFNITMREHAGKLGYTLNQNGLIDNNLKTKPLLTFTTEKEIFDKLHMEYIEPDKR